VLFRTDYTIYMLPIGVISQPESFCRLLNQNQNQYSIGSESGLGLGLMYK